MAPPSADPRAQKALRIRLVAAALVAVALGIVALTQRNALLALIGRGIAAIAACGPWVYFGAMAALPALGVPSTFFTLTAGSAFGPRLGMGWVIAAGILATTLNIAATYVLARWFLRGWLQRLMVRLGYKLPEVAPGDAADLVIILRVTPGIPLFVQNYLLGLADVHAGRYFFWSLLISWPTTAAYLWFGDSLLHGRGRATITSLGLIVLIAALTQFVRRHYAGRKSARA
ncbi:MAG TPA: VTT domain-containing protein [Opitutaceae bacterium]|nr:VTT domain-containing protein [Opitutaceae bacterium]